MNFGSDNESGACQQVIETLLEANRGYAHGYGDDDWTGQAQAELADMQYRVAQDDPEQTGCNAYKSQARRPGANPRQW